MALPNPGMSFSPFAILTAEEMNDLVENIEALAAGTGLNNNVVGLTQMDLTTFPKFSAYRNAAFTAASGDVIIPFDTEEYDIGSNFNTTTSRFVSPITGYYVFTAGVSGSGVNNGGTLGITLRKNGTLYKVGTKHNAVYQPSGLVTPIATVTAMIPLAANDYVEAFIVSNNQAVVTGLANTYMQGWRES